jgi:transcriptional/translational regulatory protein YebC/TACO1
MGRHFEVRAAAMAATAKAKSAIYMRASKEIYAAAKSGIPDPDSNLALRSAIEKYRKTTPRDVIERAIEKAKGGIPSLISWAVMSSSARAAVSLSSTR